MFLETKGDYEFANKLTSSLRDIAKELKRGNDLTEKSNETDYQALYRLVTSIASKDIPKDVSPEVNMVYADCQNLMESLERSGLTGKVNPGCLPKVVIS